MFITTILIHSYAASIDIINIAEPLSTRKHHYIDCKFDWQTMNGMIYLSNKERSCLPMDTPTTVSFVMLISTLYCALSKKKSKTVYFIPILCSTALIIYNISKNPNPLSSTMIIAGVAGALILSFFLCGILYFLRRASKSLNTNTK